MLPVRIILEGALPGARVEEGPGVVTVVFPDGPTIRFAIYDDTGSAGRSSGPSVVGLERADPRTLTALRHAGVSFVTAHGYVFLRAPGVYVDVRPSRSISDPDRTRNPFSPRGLQVCVTLLLQPERTWSISELANASNASASFVSRVVAGLEDQGLVETADGGVRAFVDVLFVAAAERWPEPTAFFVGRPPGFGEALRSGGPAYEHYGLAVPGLPRAYVADRSQLRALSVQTGASPATRRMAEWEAVIQPLAIPNDEFAPPLICALELAGDPRGREVLRAHPNFQWPLIR